MTDQSHHIYRVSGEQIVVSFVSIIVTVDEDTVKSIMENVLLRNDDNSFIVAFSQTVSSWLWYNEPHPLVTYVPVELFR